MMLYKKEKTCNLDKMTEQIRFKMKLETQLSFYVYCKVTDEYTCIYVYT